MIQFANNTMLSRDTPSEASTACGKDRRWRLLVRRIMDRADLAQGTARGKPIFGDEQGKGCQKLNSADQVMAYSGDSQ